MTDTMTQPAAGPAAEYKVPSMTAAGPAAEYKVPPWSEVLKCWQDIGDELTLNRREFRLNEAFDLGDQDVRWNLSINQVLVREVVGTDRLQRMNVNKTRARRRATTARLTSSPMSLEVRPSGPTEDGLRGQRLAEHVLQSMAAPEADDWEAVRAQHTQAGLFGGIAAVCWEWDENANSPALATPTPPPTDPITQMQLPCGGMKLTALSVDEFGLQAGSRRQQDAEFWIRQYGAPPKQVQRLYNLPVEPRPDAAALRSPMAYLLATDPRQMRLCAVTVLTKRPTAGYPGCVAHYVNGTCVLSTPWPYPHPWLNLYVFRADLPKTNTYITLPWWSDLRHPQMAYNEVRKAIREHVRRASNARILNPNGTADPDDFTDEAGEVVDYDVQGTAAKPEWMTPPEVARWLVGEVDRIDYEINDLAGSPDIARGVAPGDRNSGAALALLAEKADGPLGPFASDVSRGWSVIATSVMRTLRYRMPEGQRRQSTIYREGNSVPVVREWGRDDIDPNIVVNVPLESVMPKSQTALRASLIEMHNAFPQVFEGIDGSTLAKITGLSSLREMLSHLDHDAAFAEWENEMMMSGTVVVPQEHHNHAVHLERHERQRNSPSYEMASPLEQGIIDDHIAAHDKIREQMAAEAAAQEQGALMQAGVPPEMLAAAGVRGALDAAMMSAASEEVPMTESTEVTGYE